MLIRLAGLAWAVLLNAADMLRRCPALTSVDLSILSALEDWVRTAKLWGPVV